MGVDQLKERVIKLFERPRDDAAASRYTTAKRDASTNAKIA